MIQTPLRRALLAALCSLTLGAAHAAAPMAKQPAPGFFRMMLGDFEITALSDGTVNLPVDTLLKAAPGMVNQKLSQSYLKAPLETSVNTYLINTGSKLVLIDSGAGALFGPTLGKLVSNLKAAGYQPEQVDEIYLTHLHPDHVGGLAQGTAALFPSAVVRADRHDADYWLSQTRLAQAPADLKGFFHGAINALAPYLAAQRFQPFDTNAELVPGIKASASYGHTAGHTNYIIESKGEKLLLVGDLIHVGAVQFDSPGVTIQFDTDPLAAAAQRRQAFDLAAKEGALVGTAHIQFPGLGHVRKAGKSYQWIPVNYTQMH